MDQGGFISLTEITEKDLQAAQEDSDDELDKAKDDEDSDDHYVDLEQLD
jgi:hypothetical protein